MDNIVFVQIFQPGYRIGELPIIDQQENENRDASSTHKTQAVVLRVYPDELHDVAVLHPFRYDRNEWRGKHNAHKRQDVLMPKPFPSNDLPGEELEAEFERLRYHVRMKGTYSI